MEPQKAEEDERQKELKRFNQEYDSGKTKKVKGIGEANTWNTAGGNLFTQSFYSKKRGRGRGNSRSPGKRSLSLGFNE